MTDSVHVHLHGGGNYVLRIVGDLFGFAQKLDILDGKTDIVLTRLTDLRTTIDQQGVLMASLAESVAAVQTSVTNVQTSIDTDWQAAQNVIASQQALIVDLRAQLETALGNDAADAAAIAAALAAVDAKQAEIDALNAEVAPSITALDDVAAALNAIDLDPSNPAPVEPPVEPTP